MTTFSIDVVSTNVRRILADDLTVLNVILPSPERPEERERGEAVLKRAVWLLNAYGDAVEIASSKRRGS